MLSTGDVQVVPTTLPCNGTAVPQATSKAGTVHCGSEQRPSTPRFLVVLFRRDPSRDTYSDNRVFEGYQICWSDGEPTRISLERLCKLGCRLLGLGKRMQDRQEQLVEMGVYPLPEGLEAPLTPTAPGVRSRRLFLLRDNHLVRVHFFNGSPTEVCFDPAHDDPTVLEWIGAIDLPEGEQRWFDFTARTLDRWVNAPRGWFTQALEVT
ncbi:MAG: hypothetical protein RMI91_13605 [Gemmatales bacterium]|nr:hypothetical protein [Gemmatales bacterium]MDW7995681.1 hypothetical protein [Gemmatales bacterium]